MGLNKIGEQGCVKHNLKSSIRPENDEKDIIPEKDVGLSPFKLHSPVVDMETLYGVLLEEHLGLQATLQETSRRLRAAEELRAREQKNPINLALADRLGGLQSEVDSLRRTVAELREENDLLEFRLLEIEEAPIRKSIYRSGQPRFEASDVDDVSDSGVMSLPASDDEFTDFFSDTCKREEGDVKSRLLSLSQGSTAGDRNCIQQGLALLRHYEARIESLESTIAAMCHGATLSRSRGEELPGGRIIATVFPFTQRKDLQESGIFDEDEEATSSRGTQTDVDSKGDLTTELEKLSRIREKMETVGLQPPQELTPGNQLAFYRSRVETLESRLEVLEARPDEVSRTLKSRLQKEAMLEAEVTRLRERLAKLELENRLLEEERCELEEAENDTRLRCQKLELKISTLGEKKNYLEVQLEQLAQEMASRDEQLKQKSRMEAIVESYEKKNQELEEREMELRYRLQMLEGTMPALMMWNMWRMMMAMQGQGPGVAGMPPSIAQQVPGGSKEEELVHQLQVLQAKLETETKMLEESRNAEDMLKNKLQDLETIVESKDNNILHILNREPGQDIQAFEKLSKMAKERVEMDRRIKDLELKEKMYQETLQQVDTMFADLEGNYSNQLKEKDDQLENKDAIIAESEHKMKQNAQLAEINMQLQEKLTQLENEMRNLTDSLKKRELEREVLQKEEERLNEELHQSLQELDNLKKDLEGPMKGQLDVQRRKVQALEGQIDKYQHERLAMEAEHLDEVGMLERRISQLSKELLESDVTIGELKEEVLTLENAIEDLRCAMVIERAEKEEMKRAFEAEIEKKERDFEELRSSLRVKAPSRSLKEELEEVSFAMLGKSSLASPGSSMVGSSDEEEARRGDLRRDAPENRTKGQIQGISDNYLGSDPRDEPIPEVLKVELKSKIQEVLEDLLSGVDRNDPDLQPNGNDVPMMPSFLSKECQIAQQVVGSSSGPNVKSTINTITKAFQHSKMIV